MLKIVLLLSSIWAVALILNHVIKNSKSIEDKKKKSVRRTSKIVAVILSCFEVIPFLLPYIFPPPVIYPTDYDVVHSGPVEIKMETEIYGIEIYYTMNGRDPESEETDINDIYKYTGPFYIYESTSFTAKAKLGPFWSTTTVPSPYIKVADAEKEFVDVTGIEVSGPREILVGSEALLKAVVSPDNATDKKVKWRSLTPKIASINNLGVITAINSGIATFEVSSNSGKVTAQISVEIVAPDTTPNSSHRPAPTPDITPSPTPSITPSPTPSITPSPTPDVTPSPSQEVLFIPSMEPYVPVSTASINSSDIIYLELGSSAWLTVTYSPLDATNTDCYWSTDNPNVVVVSPEGILQATGVGSTYVNVYIGGVWDTRCVVVTEPVVYIDYIYIAEDCIVLDAYGDSYYPDLKIEPSNAFCDSIDWFSDDPDIASVDYNGQIFPRSAGTTTIYAEVHGANGYFQTSVEVYVNENTLSQDIEHAYIDEGAIELEAYGNGYYPWLVIEPEYAVIKEISWDSDDPNVATVDSDGEIHPNEPGVTTIYARIRGENGIFIAPLAVYVREGVTSSIDVDYVVFAENEIYLEPYGFSYYPNLLVFPEDATVFEITWFSDNPYIASVNSNGEIIPHEPGSTTIWAEVRGENGTFATAVSVVVMEV